MGRFFILPSLIFVILSPWRGIYFAGSLITIAEIFVDNIFYLFFLILINALQNSRTIDPYLPAGRLRAALRMTKKKTLSL
jgi:hypothetical protein